MHFWKFVNSTNSADIYIYGEISSQKWDDSDVTAKDFVEDLNKAKNKNVTVHINSSGGDVFQALAIYNSLKNYEGQVTISVEGVCASAATIIACAGQKVIAASNAVFMIHQPSVGLLGYYNAIELEKVQNALRAIEGSILDTYKQRLPEKSHAEVAQMILAETWLTADEAKNLGFVDEIDAALEVKNEVKSMDDKLIQDAIKQARSEEIQRIKNLTALKTGQAEVDAIIDVAISEGSQVSDVAKYIDAVKNAQKNKSMVNPAQAALIAEIRDNLQSGAEGVAGSVPPISDADKKSAQADELATYMNKFLGGKK